MAVAIENSLLYQEQQETRGELKLLKEFNESIIESINVGLLAVDLEGRVTRLNSALEEILDLRRDAAVGKRVENCSRKISPTRCTRCWANDRWRLRETRNIYKIHTATLAGPLAGAEYRDRAVAGFAGTDRRAGGARRCNIARQARRTVATAREAFVDWFAGGGRGARSEHAADRRFVLHANAVGDAARERSQACVVAESATPGGTRHEHRQQPAELFAHRQRH